MAKEITVADTTAVVPRGRAEPAGVCRHHLLPGVRRLGCTPLHQADRIIGAEGTCFKTVLRTLDFTRPTIGASDVAMQATTDAVQLFGGAGYTLDFPVERMMRDAKITQMYERTNQIQRMVIARSLPPMTANGGSGPVGVAAIRDRA